MKDNNQEKVIIGNQKSIKHIHNINTYKTKIMHLIYPEIRDIWNKLTSGDSPKYNKKEVILAVTIMDLLDKGHSFESVVKHTKSHATHKFYDNAVELVTQFSKVGSDFHRFYFMDISKEDYLEELSKRIHHCQEAHESRCQQIEKYEKKKQISSGINHSVGSSHYLE